jgi:hypothetical protein
MTHSRRRIVALICNVAAIVGCAAWAGVLAHAATYHVRQGGGGDCKVPQDCIGRLQPGDLLLIHAGTYPGFDMGNLSGVQGALITIKAAPGEHAVLDGYVGMPGCCGVIEGFHPAYVVIGDSDGQLEITHSDPWIDQIRRLDVDKQGDVRTFKAQYHDDPRINIGGVHLTGGSRGHHLTFQHLTIHHVLGMGFTCGKNDSNYLNNTIYDIGYPRSGYGFYCAGDRQVFRGNVIHDGTYGFHLYDGAGYGLNDSVVEHNIVYNIALKPWYHMSSGRIKRSGAAIHILPGNNNIVHYNTIYNNSIGLSVYGSANVRNNLLYQNQTDRDPDSTIGSPNFMGNPRFISAQNDFHLQSGSPGKTAANDGGEVGAYGNGYTCVGANCRGGTAPTPTPAPTPTSAPETR